ncbi:AbrB/MazE/SpoVT family DNA-binding domain-containing protein [Jiella avicenniae]|uniref:AbrB/MazE/SpoVT family DNA-binding domain-containing protein n=1 Tax=Jiella avicenniae TaxID=2907202 RepID=A0A9X1P4P4_9HYPH|nr:AbrB/MazE/SpoVT family DNA-binding domain-containing protein [Jiella avicenniae]MCE7030962.1 AbrB/MazE/SpoVT family DNA-binding domain-containing protein [Jiella avicenniae]
MKLYELPMQENGRVVLPADLRKSLGLSKGDKVLIEAEGDEVRLTTARLRRKKAHAIASKYARPGVSVVDEFLAEKRVEAEREIARMAPAAESDDAGDRS